MYTFIKLNTNQITIWYEHIVMTTAEMARVNNQSVVKFDKCHRFVQCDTI